MASTKSTPPKLPDSPIVLARVQDGLDLVHLAASQLRLQLSRKLVHEELVSFGNEGLIAAARSFDETRGVPFRAWANLKVRGAMLDGLRSWGLLPRTAYRKLRALQAADEVSEVLMEEAAARPVTSPEEADARLDSHLASIVAAMVTGLVSAPMRENLDEIEAEQPTPEEALANAQMAHLVKEAMTELPETERRMVERHYFGGTTLEEAASELGLSRSWGSRLHARAIEGLARGLARRSRPDFHAP